MSGLFGALVGGGATIFATNLNIKAINKQDQEQRKSDRKERLKERKLESEKKLRDLTNSLITELKENLAILEAGIRHKTALNKEAWGAYKGDLELLTSGVQESLLGAYSFVSRYNSLLDQEKLNRPHVIGGGMDVQIQMSAAEGLPLLKRALRALTNS